MADIRRWGSTLEKTPGLAKLARTKPGDARHIYVEEILLEANKHGEDNQDFKTLSLATHEKTSVTSIAELTGISKDTSSRLDAWGSLAGITE